MIAANAFLFVFSATTLYLMIRYKIRVEIHVYRRAGQIEKEQPKAIKEITNVLVGLGANRREARAAAMAAYEPGTEFDAALRRALWSVKNWPHAMLNS